MKVYLAGPMRGMPDLGQAAFADGAARLREAGHFVFNPVEHEAGSLRGNLATDASWICLVADTVVLLPGWEHSLGARAEEALARALGLGVHLLADILAGQ